MYELHSTTANQQHKRVSMGWHCLWQMVLAGEHWFQFLPLDDGTKTRFVQGECFTGLGVGLFKLMVSVENTRKGFIAMNEALKKEAEAKVTEKLV